MSADQIIVIRHAQKPTHEPKRMGVREDGTADSESLTVLGWRHAGALAAVLAGPRTGAADALLGRPDVIFAASAEKKSKVFALQRHADRLAPFIVFNPPRDHGDAVVAA